MIRKTIAIPDDMGAWVCERIESGQYNNESEYFRDLVRRDQEKQEGIAQLRKMLDEGEASGISTHTVPDIMKHVEGRLRNDGRLPAHE